MKILKIKVWILSVTLIFACFFTVCLSNEAFAAETLTKTRSNAAGINARGYAGISLNKIQNPLEPLFCMAYGDSSKSVGNIKLNKGKSVDVSINVEEMENSKGYLYYRFDYYINDIKIFSVNNIDYETIRVYLYIIDIDLSDSYRKLLIINSGNSHLIDDFDSYVLIRYKEDGTIQKFPFRQNLKSRCPYFYMKDNQVICTIDTPYYNESFGQYLVDTYYQLKKKHLIYHKGKYYKITKNKCYSCSHYASFDYILKKDTILNTSKGKITISAGTHFKPLKIEPLKIRKGNFNNWNADLMVYVKTNQGEKGWIYFPDDPDADILVNKPIWG